MGSVGGGRTLGLAPAAVLAGLGLQAATQRSLLAAALELQREWTKIFPSSGSGREYTQVFRTIGNRVVPVGPRKGTGRSATHKASKPGEPPAVDSGLLRASIQIEQTGDGKVKVGSNLAYARYLEYGVGPGFKYGPHPGGITIKPRPHARPARVLAEPKMSEAARGNLRLVAKGG